MEFFKNLMCYSLKIIQKNFFLVPVNNKKILFFPFNGTYYCNLKYIYESLKNTDKKFDVIWILEGKSSLNLPKNITTCKANSIKFFWHALTSKCILFNCGFKNYMYKRRKQVYIETWHGGGAYKKVSKVAKDTEDQFLRKRRMDALNNIDYVISSSKAFTKAFTEDTEISKARFCSFGMPRNDIFFNKPKIDIVKKKVKDYYSLNNEKIIIYAPTFRDNSFNNDLDFSELLETLKNKYKSDFVLFLRCHPHVANNIFDKCHYVKNIVDVSQYSDMQELLCAADVLITDYSSCMWDFSLMFRPCFIYANDIENYEGERNFHTPMSEWPFPIATNNEELKRNIINFDETNYIQAVENHHKALGSYEDGQASERVCKLIEEICSVKEQ